MRLAATGRTAYSSATSASTAQIDADRVSPAGSGGADLGEETVDVGAQCLCLPAEFLGRGKDLVGGRAGLRRRLVDADDVGGDLMGSFRRTLHVAGDFLRRRALLLDRGGNRRRDLVDGPDGAADSLDRGHSLARR